MNPNTNSNPSGSGGKPRLERMLGGFQRFARMVVRASGHPLAFGLAIAVIVI